MSKTRKRSVVANNLNNKDLKKQCFAHIAQRKFAGNVQLTSSSKESSHSTDVSSRKTEDFIDFLCFRTAPCLTTGLEVFAEPMRTSNLLNDEIFEGESDMNVSEDSDEDIATSSQNTEHSMDSSALRHEDEDTQCEPEHFSMIDVEALQPPNYIFKDIFQLLEFASKKQQSVFLLSPPSDWKTLSYVQDDLMFTVKSRHIHRMKFPVCDNFITLQCLKKQFEKDHVKMPDVPLMGNCEIDLVQLMDVVDMFGGADSVNSDQNWRALAEQLRIPKNASRRVTRLEDIYLKFILPYALQPASGKETIRQSVLQNLLNLKKMPKETTSNKMISLEAFHRMACNAQYLYWNNDATYQETEEKLWKLVNEGTSHVAAICGEIDLNKNPQSYQNPKHKVAWKLATMYTDRRSSLRYIGKVSHITVPRLSIEGIFWISDWCLEWHGFHTISYLHSGAEKIWYVIPADSALVFEKHNRKSKTEYSFLTPEFLLEKGCKVKRCTQKEGQYIVIEPGCYYCTLSTGYSLSETVCFASMAWFSSDNFKKRTLTGNDFVMVKALLNYSVEVARDNNNMDDNRAKHVEQIETLLGKINELHGIVQETIEKLDQNDIDAINYLRSTGNEPEFCSSCNACCYLFSARLQNNDDTRLCVAHAIEMIQSKQCKSTEVIVSALVSTSKINHLREKLKALLHSTAKTI